MALEIHIQPALVRGVLRRLGDLAGAIEHEAMRYQIALQAAELGDHRGYLRASLDQGYIAVQQGRQAAGRLHELIRNVEATVVAFEEADLQRVNEDAVQTSPADAELAKTTASIGLDVIPVVGEVKGLIELVTGKDLVTGEDLGAWRWVGVAGIVGLNEVKLLRHAGKAGKLLRHADDVDNAAKAAEVLRHNGRVQHTVEALERSARYAQESMLAAKKLGGRIDYGGLDELGHPTGVRATITKAMIESKMGSPASASIIPAGYRQNADLHKGHLLGKQLGGSGYVVDNLVTLPRLINHPTMSRIEGQVRKAAEQYEKVFYKVTPIYVPTNDIPVAIRVQARGIRGDTNLPRFRIDETITNIVEHKGP